jgi:hypothetical protein
MVPLLLCPEFATGAKGLPSAARRREPYTPPGGIHGGGVGPSLSAARLPWVSPGGGRPLGPQLCARSFRCVCLCRGSWGSAFVPAPLGGGGAVPLLVFTVARTTKRVHPATGPFFRRIRMSLQACHLGQLHHRYARPWDLGPTSPLDTSTGSRTACPPSRAGPGRLHRGGRHEVVLRFAGGAAEARMAVRRPRPSREPPPQTAVERRVEPGRRHRYAPKGQRAEPGAVSLGCARPRAASREACPPRAPPPPGPDCRIPPPRSPRSAPRAGRRERQAGLPAS